MICYVQLSPPAPGATLHKGYLTLPAAYTAPRGAGAAGFELRVAGFGPRYVAPHPYTGQRTVALARGPLVYCAEDVDNPWAPPHFRDVAVDPGSRVREDPTARLAVRAPTPPCGVWRRPGPGGVVIKGDGPGDDDERADQDTAVVVEERYVALRCDAWVRDLQSWRDKPAGAEPGLDVSAFGDPGVGREGGDGANGGSSSREELVLIPYYLRANRGGKGHMRVGMLRK